MASYDGAVVVRVPPSDEIVSLAEAQTFLGNDDAGSEPVVTIALGTAHAMVDGPDSDTGRCWRRWSLEYSFYGWPAAGWWRRLPGGTDNVLIRSAVYETPAGSSPIRTDTIRVRAYDEHTLVALPDAPADYVPGGAVTISYDVGLAAADVVQEAKNAVYAALWTTYTTPGQESADGKTAAYGRAWRAFMDRYDIRGRMEDWRARPWPS